jgi:predicted O-methyltransferase YrrM
MIRELFAGMDSRVVGKAVRDPGQAVMRLVLRARLLRAGGAEERRRYLTFLSREYGVDGAALSAEYAQSDFRRWFVDRKAELARFPGPYRHGTTGAFGCEALYLLVRAARPRVVVDTGVLYGASTAHILAALAKNGAGRLHSIDIGRSEEEPPHDFFIPAEVKPHWELIIGDSRRELPSLLDRCRTIDMFHHDSLHTFEHMMWEFMTAYPHLSTNGILSSDDVHNPHSLVGIFRENAFAAFCKRFQAVSDTFFNLGVAFPTSRARPASAVAVGA